MDQVDIGSHETHGGLEDGWIHSLDVVPEGCGEQIGGYWLDVNFVFVPEKMQTGVFINYDVARFCLVVMKWPDVGTSGGGGLGCPCQLAVNLA